MCSTAKDIMERCELCKSRARVFCDSDQARLCWNCDARVHSANFLVARHLRKLLCHICRSPTPWSAAGAKLSPTLLVCERCVFEGRRGGESGVEHADAAAVEAVGENHVVPPWSPPPAAESSSDEDSCAISKKRCRVKTAKASSDLLSDGNLSCSSKKSERRSSGTLNRFHIFL